MKKLQRLLNKHGENLVVDGIVGKHTKSALESYILKTLKLANAKNLICGIRTDNKFTDTFDDYLYSNAGGMYSIPKVSKCSTTAGLYWTRNFMNPKGTAVLKPGVYRLSHRFITTPQWKDPKTWVRAFQAPYFQQVSPVTVYRDRNKNSTVDKVNEETGLFGINIHRAGVGAIVDRWSAGCIVVPDNYWESVVSQFYEGQMVTLALVEI